MTEVQQVLLNLLKEIDLICTDNNISYFVHGKLALYAKLCQGFEEEYHDNTVSIAMTPESCYQFIDCFEKQGNPDRYLESMLNNKNFPRLFLEYGDRKTLDFNANVWGNFQNHGIHINIEIIRKIEKNKIKATLYRMLENGWEELGVRTKKSKKNCISYWTVKLLSVVIGKQRAAKKLFHMLVNPDMIGNEKNKVFIKKYKGRRKHFSAELFETSKRVCFGDGYVNTSWMEEEYLTKLFGKNWEEKLPESSAKLSAYRIVDAKTPCDVYTKRLFHENPQIIETWKYRKKYLKRLRSLNRCNRKIDKYWKRLFFAGDRYNLYEYYTPLKLKLKELYRANDIEALAEELQLYKDLLKYYNKYKLTLCFDYEIFQMLEYVLVSQEKQRFAEKVSNRILPRHKEPIQLVDYKGEIIKAEVKEGLRIADELSIPAILTYLKQDIGNCIYLYIDISKYGLDNPNLRLWYDTDDKGINLVVMKYYDSIQVYSHEQEWDLKAVCELIVKEKVGMVSGQDWIIEMIRPYCETLYNYECGYVFQLTDYRIFEADFEIKKGTVEDTHEIAELICGNESIGGYYEVDNLAGQLAERINTGMGRSLLVRKKGDMVAHIATYAEYDHIAVTAGLIAVDDGSNVPYGTILESKLVHELLNEDFQIYTFVTEKRRARFFDAMGCKEYGRYGKLTLKKEGRM